MMRLSVSFRTSFLGHGQLCVCSVFAVCRLDVSEGLLPGTDWQFPWPAPLPGDHGGAVHGHRHPGPWRPLQGDSDQVMGGFQNLKDTVFQSIDCTGRDYRGNLVEAPQVITQYCWVTGTYTLGVRWPGGDPQSERPSVHFREDSASGRCFTNRTTKGDRPYFSTTSETGYITSYKYKSDDASNESPCKTVHNYYQWVPYVLVNFKHALNNKMAQPCTSSWGDGGWSCVCHFPFKSL